MNTRTWEYGDKESNRKEWADKFIGRQVKFRPFEISDGKEKRDRQQRIATVVAWELGKFGNGVWLHLNDGNKTYRSFPTSLQDPIPLPGLE